MMTCKICSHPDRAGINKAILEQRSLRDIAGQYGVNRSSVDRHKRHIPKALAKAKNAETVAESTSLLTRLKRLVEQCESAYEEARADSNWTGAAAFAREIRGCLELLGKLNGELQSGGRLTVTLATIQSLDVSALTQEQVGAVYDRIENERIREIGRMSDAEIEAEIQKMLLMYRVPQTLEKALPQVIEGR
jgi:hypothetical protein